MRGTCRGKPHARAQAGFTLLELTIVIAVIAVLASISIPRMIEGRNAAYEANAHSYLRSIHQAEVAHHARENAWGSMSQLRAKKYIGPQDIQSYTVTLSINPDNTGFSATATPLLAPAKMRHFFVDTTGVVRYAAGVPADDTSTPM